MYQKLQATKKTKAQYYYQKMENPQVQRELAYKRKLILCIRQDKKSEVKVAFCPMTNMLKDFFMKPLQGSTFKRMQSIILNMPDTDKSSAKNRSVLENEKNNYRKVSRNQNTALMNTRTLKTRATSQNNGNKTKRKN